METEKQAVALDKDKGRRSTWKEGQSWFTWYNNMGVKQQTTRHIASEEFVSEESVRVRRLNLWDGVRCFSCFWWCSHREKGVSSIPLGISSSYLMIMALLTCPLLTKTSFMTKLLIFVVPHCSRAPVEFFQQKLKDCGKTQEYSKLHGLFKQRPESRIEMHIVHDGKWKPRLSQRCRNWPGVDPSVCFCCLVLANPTCSTVSGKTASLRTKMQYNLRSSKVVYLYCVSGKMSQMKGRRCSQWWSF